MFKAILYKEWIKSGRLVSLLLLVGVALCVYTIMSSSTLLRVEGAVKAWALILEKSYSVVPNFVAWFILVCPVVIAISQYSMEMVNKRLKLTLHLPFEPWKIITATQSFGILSTLVIYVVTLLPMFVYFQMVYPTELVCGMFGLLVPKLLCGLAGYFLVGWIIIEPIPYRRAINLIISLAIFSLFTGGALMGAYAQMFYFNVAMLVVAVCAMQLSLGRFKDGAQS